MFVGDRMNQMKKIQKNGKKPQSIRVDASSNDEVRSFGILVLAIVIVLLLVYTISVFVKGKDYSSIFDNSLNASEIQYNELLVGTIFSPKDENYFVLVIDRDDPYADLLKNYAKNYIEGQKHEAFYTVDLGNMFNKSAKGEDTNVEELIFKGTTLIQIENGEIKEYEEDSDTIAKKLVQMIKESEA